MNREQTINRLLERGPDEERRLALNELDDVARKTNTFGSKEHRAGRDAVEKKHDDARRELQALSDERLEQALSEKAV
jgi:hypothetical protein